MVCSSFLKWQILNCILPKSETKTLALAGVFSLVLIAFTATQKPIHEIQSENFLPPKGIVHFTFGQRELMADMYWLRLIQDFDYCEQKIDQVNCANNGWVFHMLDLISDLSPHFRMPMAVGPLMLTIVVSDIQGASLMFDKAVSLFPNDWPILYRAAYHAMLEENNKPKAADLLQRAARNGAPSWLYSLSARLYTDSGQKELASGLLRELEQSGNVDDALLNRIREKVKSK